MHRHRKRDCPRLERSSGETPPSIGSQPSRVTWCSGHHSHLHDTPNAVFSSNVGAKAAIATAESATTTVVTDETSGMGGKESTDQANITVTVSATASVDNAINGWSHSLADNQPTVAFGAATTEQPPPAGIAFSFLAESPINNTLATSWKRLLVSYRVPINNTSVNFLLVSDCGVSSHLPTTIFFLVLYRTGNGCLQRYSAGVLHREEARCYTNNGRKGKNRRQRWRRPQGKLKKQSWGRRSFVPRRQQYHNYRRAYRSPGTVEVRGWVSNFMQHPYFPSRSLYKEADAGYCGSQRLANSHD